MAPGKEDPKFYGFTRSQQADENFLGEKSTVLLSPNSHLLLYLTGAKTAR